MSHHEPPCADAPLPEVAEFDVMLGEDGTFQGCHKVSGELIGATTARELQLEGIAARVRRTLTDPRDV